MHISDWFPTLLSLVDASYSPSTSNTLDGVDHSSAWFDSSLTPRSKMVYNIYQHVSDYEMDIWVNASFAVRNSRFKLLHTYSDGDYGGWYPSSYKLDVAEDTVDSEAECDQGELSGEFTVSYTSIVHCCIDVE